MITSGPILDRVLRGSAIDTIDTILLSPQNRLSFVRISFSHQARLEDMIYPIKQCESWFVRLERLSQVFFYH